jgi:hypothetical protein
MNIGSPSLALAGVRGGAPGQWAEHFGLSPVACSISGRQQDRHCEFRAFALYSRLGLVV